jgi:hypothetical protein
MLSAYLAPGDSFAIFTPNFSAIAFPILQTNPWQRGQKENH